MPRIASVTSRVLSNIGNRKTFPALPFNAENISASATKAQLGGGSRVANTSTWTFSTNKVNFTGTGLPYHSFGSLDAATTPGVQNYNLTWTYRGGTNVEGTYAETVSDGLIGIWLNGVAMYNPNAQYGVPQGFVKVDGFRYNAAYEAGQDLGYSFGEDLAGGVAGTSKQYHYRDGNFFDAWLTGLGHKSGSLGQTGIAECSIINYLKSGLRHDNGHSKILGIAADGYPVYGPYGFSDPLDNNSPIRRMVSGYTLQSVDSRAGTAAADIILYPMGIFIEDYAFTASGTLDLHNGRYCVTPDYPQGTYAYFLTVDIEGGPVFPYIIGDTYYGTPARLS